MNCRDFGLPTLRQHRLCLTTLLWALFVPLLVVAQAEKADSVFDEEPAAKSEKAEKKPAKSSDTELASPVKDRDSISFTQQNVASQMSELEDRMFRLSEALKGLEPENASRLRLALKFSREELILHQMKETHTLLNEAQLNKAETEVRELLAKLEHLRNLLLAQDLDFQMKLARLRQMRETLSQLDRIVKEERRELHESKEAAKKQDELAKLTRAQEDLAALIRKQRSVLRDTTALTEDPVSAEQTGPLATRETAIRESTKQLAETPQFAGQKPAFLEQADPQFEDATTYLSAAKKEDAVAAEQKALDLLQQEMDRTTQRAEKLQKETDPSEFQRFERDQFRNRAAAMSLADTSARLGQSGIGLQKDLIRAGGAMQGAESDLSQTKADPAAEDQTEALKHLVKAEQDLAVEMEKLLNELRGELRRKLIADLTEMHELQKAIRETTESQVSRVAEQSRTALALVVSLSKKEAELAERTEQLLVLVEETEFGIALPTALRVISREMRVVEGWLGQGQANAETIRLELRIEEDLLGLVEAMKQLPSSTPPPPGTPLPSEPRQRERELNRLIAELKMIRLLQTRLNGDTVDVDGNRVETADSLPLALRQQIEGLESEQGEIRDSLAKIAKNLEPPQPTVFDRFDQLQPKLELK